MALSLTLFETLPRNDKGPCNIASDGADLDCVDSVINQLDSGERECMCNVECDELDYKLSVSQSVWPSKQYEVISALNQKCSKKCMTFVAKGNGSIRF